jgi:hypothetical protein
MSLTENYISIPKQLIVNLRDNPLAIALYFLVARLYLVRQQPVPLSRGDIQQFDPTAKIGAIKRALDRLIQAGWLVETIGYKSSYTPIWGKRRGTDTLYQWHIGEQRLGCPKHIWVSAIRVDRAILDLFMGKFEPHERNPHIESYFTRPLLSLHDIGAYILTAAELPSNATEALQRWGLIEDGQAQCIPDDTVVLAMASQRASVNGFQLTAAGWRRLGWFGTRPSQPTTPAGAEAAPLIFVPKEQIGSLIPRLIGESIGCADLGGRAASAAESGQAASRHDTTTIPGISRNSSELRDTPPYPPTRIYGGGTTLLDQQHCREAELPDTVSAQALFAFGVNDPTCLVELSTMSIERIGGAIAYAELEDLGPGWVVMALRRHRDEGWPIPSPRTRQIGLTGRDCPIDVEQYTNGAYGDLFRRGSDTSGLDCSALDTQVEPVPPGADAPVQIPMEPVVQPEQFTDAQGAADEANATVNPPAQAALPDEALTRQVQAELRLRCGRQRGRVIEGLHIHVGGSTTVIICATCEDMGSIQRELLGAMRPILAELGAPPQLVFTTCAGWEAHRGGAGNARSRPAASSGVPPRS